MTSCSLYAGHDRAQELPPVLPKFSDIQLELQFLKEQYKRMADRKKLMDKVADIFMTYCLEHDPTNAGEYRPRLVTVEGTSHSSLQNAILYKNAPKKETFCAQIKRSLVRAVSLADLIETGKIPAMEDHDGAEED